MRIQSSSVALKAVSSSLHVKMSSSAQISASETASVEKKSAVTLSESIKKALEMQFSEQKKCQNTGCSETQSSTALDTKEKQEFFLLSEMVYAWTGKRLQMSEFDMSDFQNNSGNSCENSPQTPLMKTSEIKQNNAEVTEEIRERFSFSASGEFITEDGRRIEVSVSVNAENHLLKRNGMFMPFEVKDPLMLNLNGQPLKLTEDKYSFDIDWDGKLDQISMPDQGNALLALDMNGNGHIDNGSELFGALTGNGFSELSLHDRDENNFIDENDPIYEKLRLWLKTPEGDQLIGLGQAGIGAIFLGNARGDFNLRNGSDTAGIIRRSGIFLKEDGTSGIIQQVDLVV